MSILGKVRSHEKQNAHCACAKHLCDFVDHYNDIRLNSAISYITPKDMLARHQREIQADRHRNLEAARAQRKNRSQRAA